MTVAIRYRDLIARLVTPWLSDRAGELAGKNVGFRVLWSMIAPLDAAAEVLMQALQAPWPGRGTPTALPFIGRSRGLLQGQTETNDEFSTRLLRWLPIWRGDLPDGGGAGSQLATALALHAYLAGHPRVRVVNRHNHWVTVETDGTITETDAAWDWDSVSHPARATHWWDEWIIVYPTPWARLVDPLGSGSTDTFDGGTLGLGHAVTQTERDEILGLIQQWKSAHTFIRAIVWSYDATLFDPETPGSLPDGTWGAWGYESGGVFGPSGRDAVNCRFWEPRP